MMVWGLPRGFKRHSLGIPNLWSGGLKKNFFLRK